MNLSAKLQEFDGRHVAPLEAVAEQLLHRGNGADELIALANSDDERVPTAATWVLKRIQEQGVVFSAAATRELLRLVSQLTRWEPKLHLLQMLEGLTISSAEAASLWDALRENLDDENKMVRAWSYNGLFVLADQHTRYRNEVLELLVRGGQDSAASVKARVRRIRKAAKWAQADGSE